MKRDLISARQNEALREAAGSWRKARLIDEPAAANLATAAADDWHRKSIAWRYMIFIFTCVLAGALFGFVAVTLKSSTDAGLGVLLLLAGVLLFIATEVQSSVLRFDGVGSESATSVLAITFLFYSGVLWLIPLALSAGPHIVASALLLGALCAAPAWRWGYPLYALAATISYLAAVLFQFNGSRFALIAFAVLLVLTTEILRERESFPSSHRMSLACISGAGLAAIYAAVNLYSLDHRFLEQLVAASRSVEPAAPAEPAAAARNAAAAATAAFPLVLLALGLRSRRRLLLDAGLASAGLSLLTLRQYVHLGPTWLVLCGSGVALTLFASFVERFLSRSPGRERAGLTAEPELPSGKAPRGAEIAGVLWNLAPSAGPAKPQEPLGGGGSFGGGGATGGF